MASETRATLQETTPTPTAPGGSGINRTERISVTNSIFTLVVPAKANGIIIRNEGAANIRMRMGAAGPGEHWLITPTDPALNIPMNDKVIIRVVTPSGTATLQIIYY